MKTYLQANGTFSKLKVKKLYQTYAIFELGQLKDLKPTAEYLTSTREEILACEWLNKRRIFGVHTDLNEMAKFKTKIRKAEEIDGKKAAGDDT